MKLWHQATIVAVVAFCLPPVIFNVYLRYRLVKNHGKLIGTALWRQWRL